MERGDNDWGNADTDGRIQPLSQMTKRILQKAMPVQMTKKIPDGPDKYLSRYDQE